MESYLDPVVTAPEPIPMEKYRFSSVVPEVSMISDTKTSVDKCMEENIWKMKHETQRSSGNANLQIPQNYIPLHYKNIHATFAKKQVRFEKPTPQFPHVENDMRCVAEKGRNYRDFNEIRKQKCVTEVPKPFEQIYMANIPDRKLDLSIIDLTNHKEDIKTINCNDSTTHPKYKEDENTNITKDFIDIPRISSKQEIENKENMLPQTYQAFLELQKKYISKRKSHNDSITDIFNYKKNNTLNSENTDILTNTIRSELQQKYDTVFGTDQQLFKPNLLPMSDNCNEPTFSSNKFELKDPVQNFKCDVQTQTVTEYVTESNALENRKICEPNNSDLFKIIAQQNEQLLILQRQVALLLERDRNYQRPIEAPSEKKLENPDIQKFETVSTSQKKHFRQENTITKQSGIFQDNQRKWGMSKFSINLTTSFDMPMRAQQKQNFINSEPKIQEITESDISPKTESPLEHSIHFQEPLNVREDCPSPQPSININMNDYESSDDEESSSEIGATFYNNLMGQVNNILKKAQTDEFKLISESEEEKQRNTTLSKVREATLKHLRSIGITVDNHLNLGTENIDNYNPSEISLTVKQLLMKYLPPNHPKQEKPMHIRSEAIRGILETRPEFSLASLEYMKKYNLISSKEIAPEIVGHKNVGYKGTNQVDSNKKILDLTALKMQPKLL